MKPRPTPTTTLIFIKINFQLFHKLGPIARSNDIFNIIHIQTIIESSWKSFFFLTVGNLCVANCFM